MKTTGRINSVESAIEDVVLKIASANDKPIERLAIELGKARERESTLISQIAKLQLENDQLREDLEQATLLASSAGNA